MAIIEVKDSDFEVEVLKSKQTILVDFWAPWCSPCGIVAPFVEEIAKAYEGKLKVYKVNVDEAQKTAAEYGIMSIPTLAIFKDGKMADKIIGAVPKATIEEKVRLYV